MSILVHSTIGIWEGGFGFPLHHSSLVVVVGLDPIHDDHQFGVMGVALEELLPQPSFLQAN
jgi:hypothetical protein